MLYASYVPGIVLDVGALAVIRVNAVLAVLELHGVGEMGLYGQLQCSGRNGTQKRGVHIAAQH